MLQRTIRAVIRPGEQSGYVGECLEIPVVTLELVPAHTPASADAADLP